MENYLADSILNIDLADYWMILRKRLLQVILVFILILLLVIAYTVKQTPLYQSACKIKISTRQPMATIEGAQITWYGAKGNEINSEITLISNKDEILNSVLDILKNKENSEVFKADTSRDYYTIDEIEKVKKIRFSEEERAYLNGFTHETLKNAIEIEQMPQSDIVAIKVKSSYRDVAVAAANILAMVYRADFWGSKTLEANETKKFIEKQLNDTKAGLEKNKKDMEKSTEEKIFLGSSSVYQSELTALRIELEKLKEKYQENHPRIIKQKNIIKAIETDLARFPRTKQEYDENLAEQELRRSLCKTLGELSLKAKIDYEAKRQKAKDEIQIISEASVAEKLKPNETMNVIAGALFGIIIGCISAFVWEGLDTSIGKIEDVEKITRLPVIAHIPLIGAQPSHSRFIRFLHPAKTLWNVFTRAVLGLLPFWKKEKPLDLDKKILFNFDPLSMPAEAYRTLRTNLQFAIGASKMTGNVIAITSTSPREGKTLTSTNLVIALAQMGKRALLVEADMRCPQIANLFKIDSKPGLSDMLIGTAKRNDGIRTFTDILMGESEWDKLMDTQGIDNLHILPCGTIPPNPSELLLSPEFRELIEELKKDYDFIVLDTPPTLPVSDSSIVGTIVDGTALIYQSDTTSRHLLLRAIQTLQKNHAKLFGIIINQLSFDVTMKSSNNYYGYGG